MDYDAGVGVGFFDWSGYFVENFFGFDFGADEFIAALKMLPSI